MNDFGEPNGFSLALDDVDSVVSGFFIANPLLLPLYRLSFLKPLGRSGDDLNIRISYDEYALEKSLSLVCKSLGEAVLLFPLDYLAKDEWPTPPEDLYMLSIY